MPTLVRVLTDNAKAYHGFDWQRACAELGIQRRYTRPYSPWTNGKAEALIKTMLRGWAYRFAYPSSSPRLTSQPDHRSAASRTSVTTPASSASRLIRMLGADVPFAAERDARTVRRGERDGDGTRRVTKMLITPLLIVQAAWRRRRPRTVAARRIDGPQAGETLAGVLAATPWRGSAGCFRAEVYLRIDDPKRAGQAGALPPGMKPPRLHVWSLGSAANMRSILSQRPEEGFDADQDG
jgi:hypothetical protein